MKLCCQCKELKPLEEYSLNKHGSLKKACKACCLHCRAMAIRGRKIQPKARQLNRVLKKFKRKVKAGADRLQLLIEMSKVVLFKRKDKRLAERRENFNKKKCRRIKLLNCFVCNAPSVCRHHIIQLQHGGHNKGRNVVCLCGGCHEKIHPWMAVKRIESQALVEYKEAVLREEQ